MSSVTDSDGRSSEARTATDPAIRRTFSDVTSSKSRRLGASTVQLGMTSPPGGRYLHLPTTIYRVLEKSRCIPSTVPPRPSVPILNRAMAAEGRRNGPFEMTALSFLLVFRLVVGIVVVGIGPGEPLGQPVGGRLELGIEAHEVPQPLGQPGQGDLLVAAALVEFLDPGVGEVHR